MFYDKEIEIWNKGVRIHLGGGVYKNGEPSLLKGDTVDIQPYSSAEAKRDYGFDIETTDTMFSEDDSYNIGSDYVSFSGDKYEIKEKVKWEDYTEYLLEMI